MAAAARLVSTTLARSSSSLAAAARRPDLLASSPRGFSSMADSIQRSGSGDITRVLFCGPYWPASTSFTKEYLQSYPFIQASCSFLYLPCILDEQ
jgi:hypothetical protein